MLINQSLMQKDQQTAWLIEEALRAGLTLGDWFTSLEKISILLKLSSADESLRFLKARALCSLDRFAEAEPILDALRKADHVSSGTYHYLGMTNFKRGMVSESILNFTAAIASNDANLIDPSIIQNLTGRAQAYTACGLQAEAVKDKNMIECLLGLDRANELYAAGRFFRAQQVIGKLPFDLSERKCVQIPLIRCLIAQGEYLAAITLATKIIGSDTKCLSAYFYRAMASCLNEKHSQCINDLSIFLEGPRTLVMVEAIPKLGGMLIFDKIDGLMLRARAYLKAGHYVEAMRDLDYVLVRRPNCQAYLDRSNAAFKLALYGTAYGDAQSALAIEPNSLDTQNQIRQCQVQLKRQSEILPVVQYQQAQGVYL